MKKCFFFSLDAFFAVLMFSIILVSIYSFFINTQELRQQYFYSEDILDILVNTKMDELLLLQNPDYQIQSLDQQELINHELTIMEQISVFQNQGNSFYSEIIFQNLTHDFLGEKYGVEFSLEGLIYGSDKNATALVSRQRFVSSSEII